MAGIPSAVCKIPVTNPASIPAMSAQSIATQILTPLVTMTAQTAAPVQIEPSTVRSATSRILYVI